MTSSKLCVTVTGDTTAELRARRDAVVDADLIELRVDTVRDPSAAGALAGRKTPVILTCRAGWEGGHFKGSEEERRAILAEALALGAEYVDVEFRAGFSDLLAMTLGRRIVLSSHDFAGTPADLPVRVQAMRATGAEVVKVAFAASRLSDCLDLLAVSRRGGSPLVLIAMGEAGLPTRILPGRFGSCWTYAGEQVAPGQIEPSRLLDEFGFRRIGPRTDLYGILGKPVAHSISPAIHNAAFRAAGVDAAYVPLEAADFDDFLAFADAIGLRGVSVTAPYKVAAFERADECDAVSRRIRSVNTLRRENGRWLGCNTDVAGFLAPLEHGHTVKGSRATVLGAGGAARSVAMALTSAGARVTVSARRRSQAEEVSQLTGSTVADWPPPPEWDLLVNATPIGTHPRAHETPLAGPLPSRGTVYDLVYNPRRTRLLEEAARAGCPTIGGLEMLLGQAHAQFEWWTGLKPNERAMSDAAIARLDEMSRPA
jgi:3-dehydroquinate dehydratase/shikimate dehydrogenase